ncbi:MAG TPA: type 1 glutamine amidotransferase [Abditibacteriaceae bacterium]|jgi:GMP synthase (glutamine-hydrolysing)
MNDVSDSNPMNIHYLQHDAAEGPGSIAQWARASGHIISGTRLCDDEPLPMLENIDWLVVLGGPMNVYQTEEYPWLVREKKFIEAAIGANKKLVGVCLGAQLIADVLGAPVRRNEYSEIGWYPVQLTEDGRQSLLFGFLPGEFTVLHWHGDTFELPRGATHIARSEACANQAFAYGDNVVGLQFHLEYTREGAQELLHCADELGDGPYIQTAEEMLRNNERFAQSNALLGGILDRFSQSS